MGENPILCHSKAQSRRSHDDRLFLIRSLGRRRWQIRQSPQAESNEYERKRQHLSHGGSLPQTARVLHEDGTLRASAEGSAPLRTNRGCLWLIVLKALEFLASEFDELRPNLLKRVETFRVAVRFV